MSRAIKFRVWNRVVGDYCTGTDAGNIFTTVAYNNGRRSEIMLDEILAEDFIPEQYTGLKDKNGVEIYEGDIVDYNSDGKLLGVVEYITPKFVLAIKGRDLVLIKGWPHQEVIGNIHENPELLEGGDGTSIQE